MKKKIRDLTSEEYREWERKNCSRIVCLVCPFKYVRCTSWVNHKDMYSNKFLDQEVDIPSPHILDKKEHDYLRAVIKPYKVNYIKKTETGYDNYFIGIVVKSSVYCGSTAELSMPYFTKGSMYKGMETNRKYTIEELELDKEWKVREIDKREKRREIFLDIISVVSCILSIIVTCLIWNCFIN